jgi:hypothetical protein
MIDKQFGKFLLICDICGRQHDEEFYDFGDAVETKKNIEWSSMMVSGTWSDVCHKCK